MRLAGQLHRSQKPADVSHPMTGEGMLKRLRQCRNHTCICLLYACVSRGFLDHACVCVINMTEAKVWVLKAKPSVRAGRDSLIRSCVYWWTDRGCSIPNSSSAFYPVKMSEFEKPVTHWRLGVSQRSRLPSNNQSLRGWLRSLQGYSRQGVTQCCFQPLLRYQHQSHNQAGGSLQSYNQDRNQKSAEVTGRCDGTAAGPMVPGHDAHHQLKRRK